MTTTSTTRPRYVLIDVTRAAWPGALASRGAGSRRGYASAEAAHARAVRVMAAYAARHGQPGGPDLRVRVAE